MLFQLNFNSERPIYQQIRDQIVVGMAQGQLSPGEKLPTVRALADEARGEHDDGEQGLPALRLTPCHLPP